MAYNDTFLFDIEAEIKSRGLNDLNENSSKIYYEFENW